MDIQLNRIYRKSDKGVAELKSHARALTMRLRTMLILVNGLDSVATLQAKMGADIASLLQTLLLQGYVEPIPTEPALVSRPPLIDKPTPTPMPATAELATRLSELRRAALSSLAPLFGPDVVIIAQPLLKASTEEAFGVALQELETKLNIYLGRKRAAALVAALRP